MSGHGNGKGNGNGTRNGNGIAEKGLLDQAFHRDLILLQQLKKVAAAARVVSAQTSPESNRGLIEGEVEHPDVG